MKTIPVALQTHLDTRSTTLAYGLKITRADADVFAFTSHDRDAEIDGDDYLSRPGLNVTSIVTTAGLGVGNMELATLHDGDVFTAKDLLNGVWRNAAFEIFRYNYESIADGTEPLISGTIGEIEVRNNIIVAELRDLRQYFQHPVGVASSKTCRYRLGDDLCTIDLGPFTETGTITGVTDNQTFRDSARTEDADWFAEGVLTWTSGANDGVSQKVKVYAADGTFTLQLPMFGAVLPGDTYSVHAGCRKRLEEDCRDKFDNVINFGGEPHRPMLDDITQPVTVDV